MSNSKDLVWLWKKANSPIIFRRTRPLSILVKLPYTKHNMEWLRNQEIRKPEWNAQYSAWEVPQAWFERVVRLCLGRYKQSYVIQLR